MKSGKLSARIGSAKPANQAQRADLSSVPAGVFDGHREHMFQTHTLLFVCLGLLTFCLFTGLFYLDSKIEHKMDYLNQRLDQAFSK